MLYIPENLENYIAQLSINFFINSVHSGNIQHPVRLKIAQSSEKRLKDILKEVTTSDDTELIELVAELIERYEPTLFSIAINHEYLKDELPQISSSFVNYNEKIIKMRSLYREILKKLTSVSREM